MGIGFLVMGLFIAAVLAVASFRAPGIFRTLALIASAAVFLIALIFSSIAYVSADAVGIVTKNAFGGSLKDGHTIATSGEMGVQSFVLSPGWHAGFWPLVYSVRTEPLVEISGDEIGLIEARDGQAMPSGQLFAPEWKREDVTAMLDANHFLADGKGFRGKQSTVLTPGRYRINPELFRIQKVKQVVVPAGEVAVLTANAGLPPSIKGPEGTGLMFADEGQMGVRKSVLPPGKYALNTEAVTVIEVWTTEMVAHYTTAYSGNVVSSSSSEIAQRNKDVSSQHTPQLEEREITVRTADGFTFPVDVRVSYKIKPEDAPLVVARLGDDEGERFRNALNSAVRAGFRNAAESVRALDYVMQRSQQEQQAMTSIARHMQSLGVTVTGVNIGNIGDEKTLGALLKTQTDRELAKQEQLTFTEQQKAAEKKRELSRAQQESEEEKKLATAAYSVKIADEEKKRKIIEAGTESEMTLLKAKAQAEAYELIARQIGKQNAAVMELLKIVGEKNIQITPRVMIHGSGGSNNAGNSALMGTLLDAMISKDEPALPQPAPKP